MAAEHGALGEGVGDLFGDGAVREEHKLLHELVGLLLDVLLAFCREVVLVEPEQELGLRKRHRPGLVPLAPQPLGEAVQLSNVVLHLLAGLVLRLGQPRNVVVHLL